MDPEFYKEHLYARCKKLIANNNSLEQLMKLEEIIDEYLNEEFDENEWISLKNETNEKKEFLLENEHLI